MRLFNNVFKNRIFQTILLGCGAMLMFSVISYMLFINAFPKNVEEEARIKQFQSTWDKRAQYYEEHPHKELN
ncbi:hypothetical protein ABWK24_19910 [Priestia megaterium]|uniref:hypothetical protein n=1 Tax=Priestia megaterium TaxID=1404 RepID=UPI003394A027